MSSTLGCARISDKRTGRSSRRRIPRPCYRKLTFQHWVFVHLYPPLSRRNEFGQKTRRGLSFYVCSFKACSEFFRPSRRSLELHLKHEHNTIITSDFLSTGPAKACEYVRLPGRHPLVRHPDEITYKKLTALDSSPSGFELASLSGSESTLNADSRDASAFEENSSSSSRPDELLRANYTSSVRATEDQAHLRRPKRRKIKSIVQDNQKEVNLLELVPRILFEQQNEHNASVLASSRGQHEKEIEAWNAEREEHEKEVAAWKAEREQHEREIAALRAERDKEVRERAAVVETLIAERRTMVQALEREKRTIAQALEREREANACQICFERPRDAIVLTCMHFLYCGQCLEQHRLRDGTCPLCRLHMKGFCELRS